ncbi:MAG: SUMF1/EgtB/PvdO family nonheme iron enzyme, partial [Bacteroidaceae bacterium]|nr:SUMF1/EgtB/PvdO family nonheme iron enzyme [Bacteroidaceae bacterium]
ISIDGKEVGETPNVIGNLLVGSHKVTLTKQGCANYENMVSIEEGKITPLEVTLETGKQITIATDKTGDDIYIDGKLSGTSPLTTSLSFGNHKVYAMRGNEKSSDESINVTTVMNNNKISLNFGPLRFSVNGVSFEMINVAGGTFNMGSDDVEAESNENIVHCVTVSGFCIGKTEVTQALWKAVMGYNPSNFKGDNLPVERVSWNDCQKFIRKLNYATGKTFRLPTEAEWEFAARGGTNSRGYKYSGGNTLEDVAWYGYNSINQTHPVGNKQANELGLYDMSGNVAEWCSDWYDYYNSSSQTNPNGPNSGSFRVYRGGSWSYYAGSCRVSCRNNDIPDFSYNNLGFRLVLEP